jgi:hypothetical protein
VEFEIKNNSSDQMLEFLIAPWKDAITALPDNDTKGRVVGDKLPELAGQARNR